MGSVLLELLLEGKISMNNSTEISSINNEAGERRGESSRDFDCYTTQCVAGESRAALPIPAEGA